jgi:hypothetical protein
MKKNVVLLLCALCGDAATHAEQPMPDPAKDRAAFEQAAGGAWREVFSDSCTGDWKQRWFLDGEIGTVKTGPEGMELIAGPEFKNDAHHMVLWTKDSFEGDLKIEYDYTRLDDETRCVTILYIQATGSGEGEYHKDIAKWSELRRVPAMATYFNHMHTYHISYAAFPNDADTTSYVRARRYMPERSGLKGTDLEPDYFPTGLFETGVPQDHGHQESARSVRAHRKRRANRRLPHGESRSSRDRGGPYRPAPHVYPLGTLPELPRQRAGIRSRPS